MDIQKGQPYSRHANLDALKFCDDILHSLQKKAPERPSRAITSKT